jgi:hypothetical protein
MQEISIYYDFQDKLDVFSLLENNFVRVMTVLKESFF